MPDLRGASDGDSSRSFGRQELAALPSVWIAACFQSMARLEVRRLHNSMQYNLWLGFRISTQVYSLFMYVLVFSTALIKPNLTGTNKIIPKFS